VRRCLVCDARFPATLAGCPVCGNQPQHVDGFVAYAPALAHGGGGFEPGYFAMLAQLEAGNFWFRARNELILWALEKYCRGFQSYLEIGCGTGFVLSGVARRFPDPSLSASEVFTAGLRYAAQRVPSASFMQMDARSIPFVDEFDVVGAFDVVEHIQEDEAVLAQAYKALKPGGHLLLSVPQHAWLWSPSDDYAKHERRYAHAEIQGKLAEAGFRLNRSTSFVSLLLPMMIASRFKASQKNKAFDPMGEFRLPAWLNEVLFRIMTVERRLIGLGLNFPVGGSRLVVAHKAV